MATETQEPAGQPGSRGRARGDRGRDRLRRLPHRALGRVLRVGSILAGLAALVSLLMYTVGEDIHPHRIAVVAMSLAASKPEVVIVGDSITEIAARPATCGPGTVNAGVAGYSTVSYGRLLDLLRPIYRNGDVVVALGSNDTPPSRGSVEDFRRSYGAILGRFAGRVRAVVAIPPVNRSRVAFDQGRRKALNGVIERLAAARNIPVIRIPEMTTFDGLHPDARGVEQWNAAVSTICRPH